MTAIFSSLAANLALNTLYSTTAGGAIVAGGVGFGDAVALGRAVRAELSATESEGLAHPLTKKASTTPAATPETPSVLLICFMFFSIIGFVWSRGNMSVSTPCSEELSQPQGEVDDQTQV